MLKEASVTARRSVAGNNLRPGVEPALALKDGIAAVDRQ
jgi:hypothetical protein